METDRIQNAQQGNQQAFQEMVELYHALVWRTIRIIVPDQAMTEDIAQEAWLQVWLSLPRYDATRPLRPWLLAIVANRCRMALRKHKLLSISLDAAVAEDTPFIMGDDTTEQVLQSEMRTIVATACAKLSPDLQRILLLRYFADLDLSEMALILNVPLGTIKSRLHRALHTVRGHLEKAQIVGADGRLHHE